MNAYTDGKTQSDINYVGGVRFFFLIIFFFFKWLAFFYFKNLQYLNISTKKYTFVRKDEL